MPRTTVALTTDNNSVSVDREEGAPMLVIKIIIASKRGRTRMIYMRKGEALRLSEALFDAAVK